MNGCKLVYVIEFNFYLVNYVYMVECDVNYTELKLI